MQHGHSYVEQDSRFPLMEAQNESFFLKRFVCSVESKRMNLTGDIPRYLDEAQMKVASVFYELRGSYPLSLGVFFVEVYTGFFFVSQVNGSGDGEDLAAVGRWLLCSGVPD